MSECMESRNELVDAFDWTGLARELISLAQANILKWFSDYEIGCDEQLEQFAMRDEVDQAFALWVMSPAAYSDLMTWAVEVWADEKMRQHASCLACNHGRDIESKYQNWKAER